MAKNMKTLELFGGSCSFSRVAEKRGHEIYTTDSETFDWVEEETETMALQNADDSHVFHFAFDNAKHFESSELVSISMQCDADISGNSYWYVSTVVEYDWNTFLGTTSAEHDSNP